MPAIQIVSEENFKSTAAKVLGNNAVLHTLADWTVVPLEKGMKSGATSLMVVIPIDGVDGLVMAETSLNVFMMAATTLAAKFKDEVEQPGWAKLSQPAKDALTPRFKEGLKRAIPNVTEQELNDAIDMFFSSLGAGD